MTTGGQRVIVGVDLTVRDEAIVEWISRFAAGTAVQVIVVYVVPRTTLWVISSLQADSESYVGRMRARINETVIRQLRDRGIAAVLRVLRGEPAHELAGSARQSRADLIVIGGPDHSALHDALGGGTTRKLELCSPVPIVVVPAVRGKSRVGR